MPRSQRGSQTGLGGPDSSMADPFTRQGSIIAHHSRREPRPVVGKVEGPPDEGYDTAFAMEEEHHAPPSTEMPADSSSQGAHMATGIEVVGRGIKELVDAVNSIEQLGIENSDLPLPKIVVVGDQSAGKSSLIEAISEIKVPRSTGTCTRCPLQINLTTKDGPDAAWTAQVTLHKKYDYYGDLSKDPSGPWKPKDFPSDVPFVTVTDRDDLEQIIRMAQMATLNPQENPAEYLPDGNESTSDSLFVKFSPNVVRLDISGPGLPNLSFYDLPGVISQPENDEDRHLVKLVKRLMKDYIRADNVLVLLATSMEVDVANSSAGKIVGNMLAAGRCIGVLTKPDRLPPGSSIKECRRILRGEIFHLGHGYFVTKQPSQLLLDRGITHAEARMDESRFFETTEPWKSEFAEFKDRFGTSRLQTALSHKLTAQILSSLPHIASQVHKKIDRIDRELNSLPEPPRKNAMLLVAECLNKLCELVRDDINAVYPSTHFKVKWRSNANAVCKKLLDLKPTVVTDSAIPKSQSSVPLRTLSTPKKTRATPSPLKKEAASMDPILLDSDSEESGTQPAPPPTPSKKRKLADEHTQSVLKRSNPQQSSGRRDASTGKFTLKELKAIVDSVSVSGIPSDMDIKAVEQVFVQSNSSWPAIITKFLKDTTAQLNETINKRVEEALGAWSSTELFTQTQTITRNFLNRNFQSLWQDAQAVLRREQSTILTMNKRFMNIVGEDESSELQKERFQARAKELFDLPQSSDRHSPEAGRRKPESDANVNKALGPDPYQNEVLVIARARAYYEVAAMRLVDNVCLIMLADFFEQCKTGLSEELKTGLGIYEEDAQDRCIHLLADDPAREVRRTQLKKEKAALLKAKDRLSGLEANIGQS